jgi:glycerate kinase
MITRRVTGPLAEMKVAAAFAILGDRSPGQARVVSASRGQDVSDVKDARGTIAADGSAYGKIAVVEMAAASGLALLAPGDRNPMATTTFGTGELMLAAAEAGADTIIVAVGGSATMDGGIGAAQACGLPVILRDGEPLSPTEPLTGADLEKVVLIKHGRGSAIDRVKIIVACDVINPLSGPTGAARVFGAQKGADANKIEWFDEQLSALARRTGNQAIAARPGAGAAGGLGFGLMAFFGADMQEGFPLVARLTDLPAKIARADLCLTGEGRLDGQSLHGKTAIGVARLCKSAGVKCVALAGAIGAEGARDAAVERGVAEVEHADALAERDVADAQPGVAAAERRAADELYQQGVTAFFAIGDGPATLNESMRRAETLLEQAAENVVRLAMQW